MKENRLIYKDGVSSELAIPAPVAPAVSPDVLAVSDAEKVKAIRESTGIQLKDFKEALEKSNQKDVLYKQIVDSLKNVRVFPVNESGLNKELETLKNDLSVKLAVVANVIDWETVSKMSADSALKSLLSQDSSKKVDMSIVAFLGDFVNAVKEFTDPNVITGKPYEIFYNEATHKIELKVYTEQEATARKAFLEAEAKAKQAENPSTEKDEKVKPVTEEEAVIKDRAAQLVKNPMVSFVFGALGIIDTKMLTDADDKPAETKEAYQARMRDQMEAVLSGSGNPLGFVACMFLGIPVANSTANEFLGFVPEKYKPVVDGFMKKGKEYSDSLGLDKMLNLSEPQAKIFDSVKDAKEGGQAGVLTLAARTKIVAAEAVVPDGKRLILNIPPKTSVNLVKKETESISATDKANGEKKEFKNGDEIKGGDAGLTLIIDARQSFGVGTIFDKNVKLALVDVKPAASSVPEANAEAKAKPETASPAAKVSGAVQEKAPEAPSA